MKEEDVIEELTSPEPRFPRRLTRGLTVKDTSGRKGHKKNETDRLPWVVRLRDRAALSVCSQDSEGLTVVSGLSSPSGTWMPLGDA